MTLERLSAALADRYRIERELGQGGMATVYLAEDVKHERQVAIKVLRPELAAIIGAGRFLAEIRTTANLQHPHILPLHDSGEADYFLFYVMPYVAGESLRDRLNREKQLPIGEVVRIATEVAGALDYAHRHHVIHRDIKPENVLLHDGSALVADFGIALAVSTAGGTRMTETGMSLGTPQYMSPEQASAERVVDARTDVYALGAVTYEMLTGEPPFTGPTTQAVIAKLMTEEPRPPSVVRPLVPHTVEAAVLTALAKLPADRFATTAQFAEALRSPGTTANGAGSTSSRAHPAPADRTTWSRAVLGGVVGVALVAGGFIVARLVSHPASLATVSMTQKTYASVPVFTARFAPDGQTIVYSAAISGMTPRLFIIRPEYPEPQPLGPDSTHLLAVSRKGEMAMLTHAVHISHRFFQGTLARMPVGGGAPREIVAGVHDADWSPDGAQLAIARDLGTKDRLEYPMGHQLYDSDGFISDIRLSPRGDQIALLEHVYTTDDRGIVAVVDRSGHHTVLTKEYSAVEGLAWSPDGRTLFFSASVAGELYQVHRVNLGGQAAQALPSPGQLTLQDVSSNGTWLVSVEQEPWRMFLRLPGENADREVSWLGHADNPIVTNDGRLFAFTDESQTAGASYAVMLQGTDGSAAIRLGPGEALSISPDQKWVNAMLPTPPFEHRLYATRAGAPRQLKWPALEFVDAVEFFPDGSLLACGREPRKRYRCYHTSREGGSLTPVTPDGVGGTQPAPDGKSVLVRRNGQLLVWPLGELDGRAVPGIADVDQVLRWSPDGRALWVFRVPDPNSVAPPVEIEQVEIATGRRRPLVHIQPPERANIFELYGVSVADDGRGFAYGGRSFTSQLFVVEGIR